MNENTRDLSKYEILIDFETTPHPVVLYNGYVDEKTVRAMIHNFFRSMHVYSELGKIYQRELDEYGLLSIQVGEYACQYAVIYNGKTYDNAIRVDKRILYGTWQYKFGKWENIV